MRNLLDMLTPDERGIFDKSFDISSAPTERARQKTELAKRTMQERCVFDDTGEAKWSGAETRLRQKVLSELIWRISCIVEGSTTAVMGLESFSLGHGFRVAHRKLDTGASFVVFWVA